MTSLFIELKRRNVIRVGAAYLVATWVLLQIGDVLIAMLELPGWIGKLLVMLMVLGFPIALIFAWAFELTPEGLKAEADVDRSVSITSVTAKKLDIITIGLVIIALAVFSADRFISKERAPFGVPTTTGLASPVQASVAVLPFANISQDEKNEPFTIGIHDDLLTQISKIGSLKTISRTSVSQYRGTTKPLDQIASELGVATILEGGVQRAGDQVRINVQLVDAQTNEPLWAERYERRLTAANIFDIQSEIVKAIADALQTKLSAEDRTRINSVPTKNLEALEFYFAGNQRLALRNTEAFKEAIYYFEQAVALDPDFALAYVALADSYQLQEDAGGLTRDEMFAKAGAALEKALMLDSQLGEAYNSMGGVEWTAGDWAGAEAMFKKSIELNPNYATTYLWYGTLLLEMGRVEEAAYNYGLGLERDPQSSVLNESLGTVMEFRGRYDEAVKQYRRAIHYDASFASSYLYLGNVNWTALGRIDQAIACHKTSIDYDPGARLPRLYRGLLYLDLGDVQKAEPWIGSSLRLAPQSLEPLAAMALLDWYRGNESEALRNAEQVLKIVPYYWDHRLFQSMALSLLRNSDLQRGNLDSALARYENLYPDLLKNNDTVITLQNYRAAIDLAYVLQKNGDLQQATSLLDKSLAFIEAGSISRLGVGGYGIADAQIHALQGDGPRALAALRQAIDQGWRGFWWFYLRDNPNLHALQGNPEFQSMVKEIESSMLGQHEKLGEAESCSVL